MPRYAKNTRVSTFRSREQIEKTLHQYGIRDISYASQSTWAGLEFFKISQGTLLKIRFILPLPDRNSKEFVMTPAGRKPRAKTDAERVWEQACRQRWRALHLAIKAKLEAVECGISSFEQEFLPHVVLPNDKTVAEWMVPHLQGVYAGKQLPPLLTD